MSREVETINDSHINNIMETIIKDSDINSITATRDSDRDVKMQTVADTIKPCTCTTG